MNSKNPNRIALICLFVLVFTGKLSYAEINPGLQFDNEIDGKPEIECKHDEIKFNVNTMKNPPSSIYVKGNSDHEECVFKNIGNASFPLNKCNMRRKREISPSGVGYSFTVVVQLHPLFITKVDRAYNVHCFYMETQRSLESELEVSDPTTQTINGVPPLPECQYTVHRDSPHGPLAKYARVGDVLFHVWECQTDMYSMLLHSCLADDGSGNKFMVVDDKGCASDEYLMPQITYNENLTTAMAKTNAFMFADKTTMTFSCQIQLCFIGEDCSSITPPKCGNDDNIDEEEESHELENEITTTTERVIAGNVNSISNELEKEQLIPSSASTPEPTTSPTTTGPLVALPVKKHPKDLEMPADFPRPNFLPSADNLEGSGEEDSGVSSSTSTTSAPPTTATLKVLEKKSKSTKPANRPQRHSGPKPRSLVNMDVQSPELMIMDDYLDPSMQQASPKPLYAESESSKGILKNRVCVPATGFYASLALIFLFGIIVIILLIKSRKSLVHKFY
ncbi:hypothetical protein FO519_002238 [Halicephalobus sp. NKZ332]|nr:hypothetical protein FO519_002238 [Halicephalobus sp. NKZ332]